MSISTLVLWILGLLLMAVGLFGTIAPGLPGAPLIFAGMLLIAWLDHFTRIGALTLGVAGALALLTLIVDLAASLLGARRVGASRQALWGSVLGSLAGLPFGIAGLIVGPFAGACIGEWLHRQQLQPALRVGIGTWLGMMVGTVVKLAIAITMLGLFIAALLID